MNAIYPLYDFLLIFFSIGILGVILNYSIKKHLNATKTLNILVPFAIALIIIFALSIIIYGDLPIKFYDLVNYDYEVQKNSKGPDIGAGIVAGFLVILSFIVNIVSFLISILIIALFLSKNKKTVRSTDIDF
ncbi:MAG: hypothetical protein COA33_001470 [Fluviicola sp.]|nr:hypothetical protein [Fluviicola sp.]